LDVSRSQRILSDASVLGIDSARNRSSSMVLNIPTSSIPDASWRLRKTPTSRDFLTADFYRDRKPLPRRIWDAREWRGPRWLCRYLDGSDDPERYWESWKGRFRLNLWKNPNGNSKVVGAQDRRSATDRIALPLVARRAPRSVLKTEHSDVKLESLPGALGTIRQR